MKNINNEMSAYREAVRHLWNSTFSRLDEDFKFGPALEIFEEVDFLLFRAIVCEPHGIQYKAKASFEPITEIQISPKNSASIPVMINRSIPASGYWDDPQKNVQAEDVRLALIGFFDWDGYTIRDCQYYRVRIVQCHSNVDLVGRDALVETFYADAIYSKNT